MKSKLSPRHSVCRQVLFVGTAPHVQRRGLGRLLMQNIMKTAVEQGQHVSQ